MAKRLFTSESVTEGHPDKICDQISDAVLDAILAQDKNARVACETAITTGLVLIMGEITTTCNVDFPKVIRETVRGIGYDRAKYGFDCDTCSVITSIDKQSADIAMGVDNALETRGNSGVGDGEAGGAGESNGQTAAAGAVEAGAGDQGMMFGYASDETPELMPAAISYSHKLTKKLADLRKSGELPYLRPDGKAQVTIEYDDDKIVRIDTVVMSTQHDPEVEQETIHRDLTEKIIKKVLPAEWLDDKTKIYINPTGRFVVGGPQGDSGVTGRKIIVDTYGGYASHGGGAFSGKDPSKVDRSAAYMARYIAKNIVAAGLAHRCEVQLAYAIGVANPVSIMVDTDGTGKVADEKLAEAVAKVFKLTPNGIISSLDLLRPIYSKTAAYGHFGREDADFTWEKTDKVDELRVAVAEA